MDKRRMTQYAIAGSTVLASILTWLYRLGQRQLQRGLDGDSCQVGEWQAKIIRELFANDNGTCSYNSTINEILSGYSGP
jgi:hypothetical protein